MSSVEHAIPHAEVPSSGEAVRPAIKTVAISEFKAKCLALIEEVNRTGQPLRITRRGKPLAEVVPAAAELRPESWLGRMAGTMEIVGDIMEPTMNLVEWEALKD